MAAEDLFSVVELGEEIGPYPGQKANFKAAANITKGQLVVADTHTDQELVSVNVAGAGAVDVIGVALQDIASGAWGPILLKGLVKVTASAAITAGYKIISAANGQIAVYVPGDGTAANDDSKMCGICLQDAGEAGDEVVIFIGL